LTFDIIDCKGGNSIKLNPETWWRRALASTAMNTWVPYT